MGATEEPAAAPPVGTPVDSQQHPWSAPASRSNSADFTCGAFFGGGTHHHQPQQNFHDPFGLGGRMGMGLQPGAQSPFAAAMAATSFGEEANSVFDEAPDMPHPDNHPAMHRFQNSSSTMTTCVGSTVQTSTTTIANGVKTTRSSLTRPGQPRREKVETVCLLTGKVTSLTINGKPSPSTSCIFRHRRHIIYTLWREPSD